MTAAPRTKPARHRLLAGPFLALEPALFRALADLQETDPLRLIAVVVTSNLLGVHLRRRYLEWREEQGLSAAHGGIAFSTLETFASELAGPGPPPLPAFGEFAILSDALARVPESRAFGELASRPDFVPSLEATVRDLADAGVAPKAFRAFAESASLTAERKIVLGAVARLYEELEKATTKREPTWKLFRRAGAAPGSASSEPVLLYGYYDATGIQREFLATLARRRPIFALVPRPQGRWGAFAEPFLNWAASILESALETCEEPRSPLAAFRERLGGETAAVGGGPGGAVRLVSAATASGERTEIAREILIAAEAGIPLHRMGVIARESSPWSRALSRELSRLGIPNFEIRSESAAASPVARAARLWWDLEQRDFSREDVLGILDLLADVPGRDAHVSARNLVRRAGIVRGETAWTARLEDVAARASSPLEAAAALALAESCRRLTTSASSWPAEARSWRDWAAEISARLEALFSPAPVPESLRGAAETMAALEDLGGRVERPAAAHVFFGALEQQPERSGKLGADGVAVGTSMSARGLTFEATFVSHLVEGEFPAPGRPDPLLFDAERLALSERTGRQVPIKVAPRLAEERLLFGIAVGSATRHVVLTACRRDEALTRDRLASPFFADAERAAAFPGSEFPLRTTEMGRSVTLGPAVSVSEASERVLERSGSRTVAAAYDPLARAFLRQELAHSRRWTAFEGKLGPASRSALARHLPSAVASMSASRVAKFATCPHRYFLASVQGLREWDESERAAELDPLALGKVFHDAARRVVNFAGDWPPVEEDAVRLALRASEDALAEHEKKTAPLFPPLIRTIARDRIESLVLAWLAHEATRRDGLRPAAAEKEFGTAEAPFAVDAGPLSVRFTGSIDRVDEDSGHLPARVIDYKVKMASGLEKTFGADGRILGGEAVQLPVYALAVGSALASEYLVLRSGSGGPPSVEAIAFSPDGTREAISGLRSFLEGMEGAVASGTFTPRTAARLNKEPCSFCEFAVVCGPGHVDRFAAKDDDDTAEVQALRRLRDLP